jgi:hypothetical protein
MERLTYRDCAGVACFRWENPRGTAVIANEAISRLAAYEDSGLSPEEVQELKVSVKTCEDCWNHAQAKAEGRLVVLPCEGRLMVLPCKVGDTVYEIVDSVDMPYARQEKVIAIELWNKNGAMTMFIRTPYGLFEFGKTVFLTREEAEGALQKEAQHE